MRRLLGLLCLFVLAGSTATSLPARAAPSPAPAQPRLPALHAVPDPVRGGRIVDAWGREVVLRGVNVNAHVDYWQGSRFRTTFPFTEADAARMAGIGWNVVRLLVSWSRVEPRPGQYDDAYLDEVATSVRRLARHRIYAVIDLHQDAWGPTLAARPDEDCPEGTPPALGWDGAPGWATLDVGADRCALGGVRELSPAVRAAFSAFWADAPGPGGVGIRTRYERMVGHVAGRFARWPAVAGYDVMNEPNAFGSDEVEGLADLYEGSLREIRAAERRAGGFRHLVLFEPSVVWSDSGGGVPTAFDHDRDVVYAPHLYTGGFTGGPIDAAPFERARADARAFGGAPVLTGEWGTGPDRAGPDGDGYFLDHQRLQDEHRIGATLWTWRESCGDPHKVGDLRAGRIPSVWGEFEVDCRTNTITGVRRHIVDELRRGHVRAAPGRLHRVSFDPAAGRLVATGWTARTGIELEVFVPWSPADVRVAVRGLRPPRVEPAPGGGTYVRARSAGGAWEARITRD